MTKLTGEEAKAFSDAIDARNKKLRAEALAREKAAAVERGKEPFDLQKLETMCDTSTEGRLDPEDVRLARYEFMYYVQHPEFMTLKELADLVTHLSQW
jgi:hypothetical protein